MHVNLPKPLHGWRAFVGEVGIIVLGVLIALGAEQAVQSLHARTTIKEDTDALRREVADHYSFAVEWRVLEPCIAAQIDNLESRLLESGDKLTPAQLYAEGSFVYVIRTPERQYVDGAWQSALRDGTVSSMSGEIRQQLNDHYEQIRQMNQATADIERDVPRLNSLGKPLPLDPSSRLGLFQDLEGLRFRSANMDLSNGQIVGDINRLGMVPTIAQASALLRASGTYMFCKSHHLPIRSLREAVNPLEYSGTGSPIVRKGP
jgi:hypothetical protein